MGHRAAQLLLMSFLATACNFSEVKQGSSILSAEQLSSFSALESGIFQPKCARCHSGANASGGLDLTNYQSIISVKGVITPGNINGSSLYTEVASGDMPDGGPVLGTQEVLAISQWILAGAPDASFNSPAEVNPAPSTSGVPTNPAPVVPVASATYKQVQTQIFSVYCTRCHSGTSPSAQIDLSSFSALMKSRSGGLIVAGSPSQSLVYSEISSGSMPPRGSTVPTNLQQILSQWISQGAKND